MGRKHRHRRSNMIEATRQRGFLDVPTVDGLDDVTYKMLLVAAEASDRPGVAVVPIGAGYGKVLVWTGHLVDRGTDERIRSILRDAMDHQAGLQILENPDGGYVAQPMRLYRARALAGVIVEAGKDQNDAVF